MDLGPLPVELRAPAPRPLPAWEGRRPWLAVTLAIAMAFAAAAAVVARRWLPLAALVAATAVTGPIARAARTRRRRLLAAGIPTAALVVGVRPSLGGLRVFYRYDAGPAEVLAWDVVARDRALGDLGGRPEAGDIAFVVWDRGAPTSSAIWSFAPAPGRARRPARRGRR
ncbi:MAG TPA: hypothetical protein VLU43_13640 [Anaeromyxobacteraceae bacterium]|nr:hypothetical protein [Anaeromyxobacteraceae bacterium]